MKYNEINSNSRRIYINAIQCYEALKDAKEALSHYRGNMAWESRNNKEYLIHKVSRSITRSLGPRSEKTEEKFNQFVLKKAELSSRVESLKEKQNEHARFCKAVFLDRVPLILANLSRRIAEFPALEKKTRIVGTHSLYAYEAAAGVHFEQEMIATIDVDVLWDTRKKISIASAEPNGFLGILQSVDKTFRVMGGSKFRAVNKEGFMVDLIQPTPKDVLFSHPGVMSDFSDDLIAVEIKGLAWLVSCPKFKATGIDEKGYPVDLVVPDPRAYAMHKYWLSHQDDRDPVKKERDFDQAKAVFELVNDKLPFLSFSSDALMAMPFKLRDADMFRL
jgi:hypothetical protein